MKKTILMTAFEKEDYKTIKLLLSHQNIDVNVKTHIIL